MFHKVNLGSVVPSFCDGGSPSTRPCFSPLSMGHRGKKRYIFQCSNCGRCSRGSKSIPCVATNLLNVSFCFHAEQLPVPKNPGDRKPVKADTSPVAPRAGLQPKPPPPAPQPSQRPGPGLQLPAVPLYPSRKKVPLRDLPPFGR